MARTTRGSIFKRGKYYWLQYSINKERIRIPLKNDKGESITTVAEARIAADKILSVIRTKDEAQRLRLIQSELDNAEKKETQARQDLENSLAVIAAGWDIFMQCPNRPACCRRVPADKLPPHSTPANYACQYRQFTEWLKIHYEKVTLISEITPKIAAAYALHLENSGLASGTINKHIGFLKLFFKVLIDNEEIHCTNPFLKLQRKEGAANSRSALSSEQIARLLDSADGELRLLFALGYFTGLRLGDCCTLEWKEVDLSRRVIERIPRKTKNTRKDTGEAIVKIGINPFLQCLLTGVRRTSRDQYVLPRYAELYLSERDNAIIREVNRHFRQNGIVTTRPGTGPGTGKRAIVDIGFHSLRYSYISHNAEAGVPAAVIQKNAGHANPAMTEHYTRISDQAARQYAAALQLSPEIVDAEFEELPASDESENRIQLRKYAESLTEEQIEQVLQWIRERFDSTYPEEQLQLFL